MTMVTIMATIMVTFLFFSIFFGYYGDHGPHLLPTPILAVRLHRLTGRQGDWRSQLSLLQPCILVAHSKALCPQYMEWKHSIGQTGSLLHFPWEISGLGP